MFFVDLTDDRDSAAGLNLVVDDAVGDDSAADDGRDH